MAQGVVGLGEVHGGCEVGDGVGEGLCGEEHDVGELGREADLADPGDDLVEPGGRGLDGGGGIEGSGGGWGEIGLVLELLRLDPEPREAGRAGRRREELESERWD